ncbi:MAG: hypothetical protein IH859_02710 [Chloroflexi bacterium]|nr:hypothetical protein [Chloroflexota bacterium]
MSQENEIKHLLIQTVQNHHQYQESHLGGKYNTDWSSWYAEYLLEHGLSGLWGREITQAELAELLNKLDEEYNAEEREGSWPTFYANKMVSM